MKRREREETNRRGEGAAASKSKGRREGEEKEALVNRVILQEEGGAEWTDVQDRIHQGTRRKNVEVTMNGSS